MTALSVDCGTIGCRVVRDRLEKAEAEVERLRKALENVEACIVESDDPLPAQAIIYEALRTTAARPTDE